MRSRVIADCLAETAARNPGLACILVDDAAAFTHSSHYPNGWKDFLSERLAPVHSLHAPLVFTGEQHGVAVDLVIQWAESRCSAIQSWVNGQRAHGGSHLIGFEEGIWKALWTLSQGTANQFVDYRPAADRAGLHATIDIRMSDARWIGPLKGHLQSERAQHAVRELTETSVTRYFSSRESERDRVLRHLVDQHWAYFRP
jgi:DNA gyrase/topoisomerase IV subunit B